MTGHANYRWAPLKRSSSLLLSEILRYPVPFRLKGHLALIGSVAGLRAHEQELRPEKGAGGCLEEGHLVWWVVHLPACGPDGLGFAGLLAMTLPEALTFPVPQFPFLTQTEVCLEELSVSSMQHSTWHLIAMKNYCVLEGPGHGCSLRSGLFFPWDMVSSQDPRAT